MEKEYTILIKYLSGHCTEEERLEIEEWVQESHENEKLYDEVNSIWEGWEKSRRSWDFETSVSQLMNMVDGIEEKENLNKSSRLKIINHYKHRPEAGYNRKYSWLIRVAVIAFIFTGIAVVFSLLYTDTLHVGTDQRGITEIVTRPGNKETITLRDGTIARINVDSRLTIPENYGEETRSVYVDGEVYFEVQPDVMPFIVSTDVAAVEVLGTSFNFYSYHNEPHIKLVVVEGEVCFRSTLEGQDSKEERVVLRKGEMAVMARDGTGDITETFDFELQNQIGWLENRLVFDYATLEQIGRQLERWYDVEILIENEELKNMRLSAVFINEPLYEVLRVMEMSLNLQFQIRDNKIVFYSNS